jgi:hypothetical protein
MINYLRKYLFYKSHVPILSKFILNRKDSKNRKDNNNKKVFYIIKRDRWHGMFSNIHFIILHMIYAKKKKYIPIVDMKYYPTIYNEKNKIKNTFNSWEYYFKQIKNIKLDIVYKSNNFILSKEKNINTKIIGKKNYKNYRSVLFNLKFDNSILKEARKFQKKYFKNKKILGVHFRGSDQKNAASHPFPPTIKQMMKLSKEIFLEKNFDLIFLVTEEAKYYRIFKKYFKDKLISYKNYRSNNIFYDYPRKNHRYLLGYEIIINMLLLSNVNFLVHSDSNVSAMSRHYRQKKIDEIIIYNGLNSKNIFLCNILWYLKYFLPYKFGGFKNLIIKK